MGGSRARPVEDDAPGRSRKRYRAASMTAVSSIGVRGISVFTTLISVPLAIDYLGTERYGLFVTISSLVGLLGFTDLGLGNAVLTPLSTANAADDRATARIVVSSSMALLTLVALTLGILFLLLYGFVSWGDVFNVSSHRAVREAGPALAVLVATFALNIPLGLVERVQLSLQSGFVYNAWLALASVGALGAFLIVIQAGGGLPWLILALTGAPIVASSLNWAMLWASRRTWLRPSLAAFRWPVARSMLKSGLMFFALQAAVAIAYSSDALIVTRVLGPEAVPEYAVPFKMFNLVSVVSAMAVSPLWPAYAESIAVGDIAWARAALSNSLTVVMLFAGPGAALLVIFGPWLLDAWVGSSIEVSRSLLVGLGVWTVLAAAGTTAAMFLNAAGVLRTQVILSLVMTCVNVPLSVFLVREIGVAGAVWGSVISYGVVVALPLLRIVPRTLNGLGAHPSPDALLAVQEAEQDRSGYWERPS